MTDRGLTGRVAAALVPLFMRNLRLRTRFLVLVISAVVSFGTVNLVLLDIVAGRVLTAEVEDRALASARHIAGEATRPMLREDLGALRGCLDSALAADPGLGYAFIVSSDGSVVASTFADGIPAGLVDANPGRPDGETSVVVSDRGVEYRDVAVPIFSGTLGGVRVGARMDRVVAGLRDIQWTLVAMVVVFLAVGLLGAWLMARMIATPVEELARAVQTFDPAEPSAGIDVRVPAHGEIADLVRSFERMAVRLRQLHEDRQTFQDRILRAERLATVGTLAAGIAHDVNNPLAGLLNCLQAISREPQDVEQTRAYARMMIDATRSIERTVRDLIDVAARSRPRLGPVDVRSLVDRVAVLVRHRFDSADVSLGIEVPEPPPPLHSDEGLLQQVLVNLLMNACDASPRGEAVTLRVRGGAPVVFDVVDRGAGIAPEIRERIFDAFVTTKTDKGGTGLGLAMVRRIVEDLCGEVSFDSGPGRGTRFTVTLAETPGRASGAARRPDGAAEAGS